MSAIVLNTGSFCTHLHGFERYTKALKGKSAADDNEIAKNVSTNEIILTHVFEEKGF